MSDPTINASSATGNTTSALSWLQRHERIVIVFIVLLAGTWIGQKYLNVRADHDKQEASIAAQQLDEQRAKDAQVVAQVNQLNAQYQSVTAQLSQANAQLAAAISNRNITLQKQQTTDKTLPMPDLGNRWAQLAQIAPTDITATQTGISVSDTGARETVDKLETIPVLTSDLQDETTVADNRQAELSKANTLIGGLNTQVSGLNTTIKDEESSCKTEVASVKAQARKSKLKTFGYGVGAGVAVAAWLFSHI